MNVVFESEHLRDPSPDCITLLSNEWCDWKGGMVSANNISESGNKLLEKDDGKNL